MPALLVVAPPPIQEPKVIAPKRRGRPSPTVSRQRSRVADEEESDFFDAEQ